MAEHRFMLAIVGVVGDAQLASLDEAGCGDATFVSQGNDVTFAEFVREASTLLEAVVSAVVDVESVTGFEVLASDAPVEWAAQIEGRTVRPGGEIWTDRTSLRCHAVAF